MASKLDALLKQSSEWLRGAGPVSDIVMSSRVRLARNLQKIAFAARATKESMSEVLRVTHTGLSHAASLKNASVLELDKLDEVDRQFLVERHLISREHSTQPEHKSVVFSKDEVFSVMINEEDHLRLQVMQSGFDLRSAWERINTLDDELAAHLNFAYSSEWGYLTCCPTNTGTGLRASIMKSFAEASTSMIKPCSRRRSVT